MQVTYKTYTARVTFCRITNCFYGEVEDLKNGYITFSTRDKLSLRRTMQLAVDHYLLYNLRQQIKI